MAQLPKLGPIHHIRLAVSNVERSRDFYTDVLGLEVAIAGPPPVDDPTYDLVAENLQGGIVLTNGTMLLGLRPMDQNHVAAGDKFNPFRAGLDHFSFSVGSRGELENAAVVLDELGVSRGQLVDLPMFGIAVLPVQDPDGIQLELTAPI